MWHRIHIIMFLYYLRAFNSDIATTLQNMGVNNFPDAYKTTITEENVLIQGGRFSPRLEMPLFLDISTQQHIKAPKTTTFTSQPLVVVLIASISSSGTNELKGMMQNLDKKFQDQSLEMKNIKQDIGQ